LSVFRSAADDWDMPADRPCLRRRCSRVLAAAALLLVIGTCAPASASADPRAGTSVVGGAPAQAGILSSVVFVTSQTSADSAMACSGTVVAPTVVLTAAHCLVDEATGSPRPASGIVVSAGRLARTDTGTGQDLSAARVIVHPAFDRHAIRSDAAVILLSTPAAVAPVPLLTAGESSLAASGTRASFAGWGTTSGASSDPSPQLLTTTTTLLQDAACRRLLGGDFDSTVTLCAIDEHVFASSTCRGDSGGPLLLQRADGLWVQAGVTSWGSLGCDPHVPQAFTRVSAVADWVAAQIAAAPATGVQQPASDPTTSSRTTTQGTAGAGSSGRLGAVAAARYAGSTRQRRAIAVRVAHGGRTVAAVGFGYRARCGERWRDGTFRSRASTRLPIAARSSGAAFATLRADAHGRQVRVRGAFTRSGRLTGTVRVSWRERDGVRCDSGLVRYSARR
jgi:secreted trypsin-like serine protease